MDPVAEWFAQANALKTLGRIEEALACYDRAVAFSPDDPFVHYNLGNTLDELQRWEEALASYDRAISLRSDFAEAHNNRGMVFRRLGRFGEALESYDRAVAFRPDYAPAYHNRGIVLQDLDRLEDALESYDRMLALRPDFPPTHYNRGNVLKDLKRPMEALESYDHVLALVPDHAPSQVNKSLLLLLLGDYRQGWPLYEWRWRHELQDQTRVFTQPHWSGDEPLAGRTLLIHAEQGLGDVIQFCRYTLEGERLGAKVVLEAPASLVSLLKTLPGKPTLVEKRRALPHFDLHCPVMSLPLAFKTKLETIPAGIPYLSADPDKRTHWRKGLGGSTRTRIGLAWSGSSEHKDDPRRSIALRALKQILDLPFEFHSLQVVCRADDTEPLKNFTNLTDHRHELQDFSDTAALIAEMDLVLTVDTAIAHLAGAMGKPVWVMLPFVPDFRWLLDRADSPWYPTAKLWRQGVRGDWKSALERVAEGLRQEY